ncbi:hypothetical protein HUW51_00190 (plasmid) [Adhaeribacter swui]|uniref:Immunity MXAN-0049 protein domain-containing protein n=1 Tax=Adhaeribacter swui TaxID=2086471 RepID=A0A7G7G227_9BACT|nr:DUF1629 domain-containing protein [Adhaeribacter swui]QNF31211.1 hypothetical protein HUW51_00190 [Adhaeribacter swui]
MKYYWLTIDWGIEDAWILGDLIINGEIHVGTNLLNNAYSNNNEVFIVLHEEGRKLDFSFAHPNLPVVNSKITSVFKPNEVKLFPVSINDIKYSEEEKYYIIDQIEEVDCVDELRSNYEIWEIGNPIRPDKAGQYRSFFKLVIEPSKTEGKRIFRLKNYKQAIIISSELKRHFEEKNVTGIKFLQV